ncbi:MAG: hypothetical protein ACYCWE_15370 [Eubacteriales bacterium]
MYNVTHDVTLYKTAEREERCGVLLGQRSLLLASDIFGEGSE